LVSAAQNPRFIGLGLLVFLLTLFRFLQPNGQFRGVSLAFQLQTRFALNPLERRANVDLDSRSLCLKLGPLFEVGFRLIGPAKFGTGESTEVVAARIMTALVDCHRQQLVSPVIFAGIISMHTLTVQFQQQTVLCPSRRDGQPEERQQDSSEQQLPGHERIPPC